ncbi:MAG: accessory factor UbiK family protein [Pseudomonadota bacterium]
MATKNPAPWDILQHLNELIDASGVKGEVDKSARALAQSALSKLDVVSREEFDAQTEVLRSVRATVTELEAELKALTQELEELSTKN